ncbi:peptide/nickel transport system substrate-binding protein [Cryobacterium sp. CAN_C3]|uniref:ABC transporter substrate-binding protein n=1 Tax=unclassified Cryobacterium TaxID=2649013 RepID=UPI0018CB5B07|nr:ABC transporter substrate-binding protein [Cryobacterium sp. CAN_C3]MEC5153866.1 peptide/nickel transport system substrate-binding protein [Cryobacterium sp. CAN_C3]
MTSAFTNGKRALAATAGLAAAALVLAGCSAGGSTTTSSSTITVGTTDKITVLDPAGSYDAGSFAVQTQVFPFLMNSPYGTSDVEPDIATKAEFTSPTEYTVTLKPDLKWANGKALTSSDVKFSFDRQVAINDASGPAVLLYNLDSVATPDDTTVVFTLKAANDQVFPQILSSPAAAIVDEDTFSADAITPDEDIVKAQAFAGQYELTTYNFNSLLAYKAYAGYQGLLGPAKTENINVKYYTDASNLKLDIQEGQIDVAWRSLSATDIDDLRGNDKVKVVDGPGGEIRYLTFNFNTQPFGATTAEADPAKALAVRAAVADVVDRAELADQVYKGSYSTLFSYVPDGLTGANESLKGLYGDGKGGPDVDKAKAALDAAGITTPVVLNLQYNTDHYGPGSSDEYALIKNQLESSDLFSVNLQSTEYVQYSKDRVLDLYPIFQLGWFPDYSDADNYLNPFFGKDSFLKIHYENQEVIDLVTEQAVTGDAAARTAMIEEIQNKVAADLPTIPLLQGSQIAITGTGVTGTKDTLDASFKFRYGALSKG